MHYAHLYDRSFETRERVRGALMGNLTWRDELGNRRMIWIFFPCNIVRQQRGVHCLHNNGTDSPVKPRTDWWVCRKGEILHLLPRSQKSDNRSTYDDELSSASCRAAYWMGDSKQSALSCRCFVKWAPAALDRGRYATLKNVVLQCCIRWTLFVCLFLLFIIENKWSFPNQFWIQKHPKSSLLLYTCGATI